MAQKTWVVGEEVLAADFNTYVQNQVVARFATVAARDSAWPAATAGVGAACTTTDTGQLWVVGVGPPAVWLPVFQQTPWIAATFLSSWSNVGGANLPAEYRKVGDVVEVHGLVKGTGGLGPVIQLPVGLRPARGQLFFPCDASGGYGSFYVKPDGVITAYVGNVTATFGINCMFSVT